MKTRVTKICGAIILVCTLFLNMICVQALGVSVTSRSHNLGIVPGTDTSSQSLTAGYGRMEIVSTTSNVITVKVSLVNVGANASALSNFNTVITLPEEVVANFAVALGTPSSHGTPSYSDGAIIINWNISSTIAVGDTAYMVYTLTPKTTVATSAMNTKLFVATSAILNMINDDEGEVTLDFASSLGCVPSFTLTDGSTPTTGLFTNIALLVGIIGASAGVLVLSLKNNKFKNI